MGSIGERKLAETEYPFGLAADVDEQLVLILRDDEADEDLTFIENLEALFVHALFERELVFFEVFRRRRCDVGCSNEIPLYSMRRIERCPVTLPRFAQFPHMVGGR